MLYIVAGKRIGAAQQGLNACLQLGHTQRLDHEVIRPALQPLHHIAFFAAVGDEQNRQLGLQMLPRPAHHLRAAGVGQFPVHDQQVKRVAAQRQHQRLTF